MKYNWWLLLIIVEQASAQIPRNNAGVFEYTNDISTENVSYSILKERARTFFNQPFLVHWTSIEDAHTGNEFTGSGYLDIHVKNHYAAKRAIPVLLRLSIEIKEGGFRYTVTQLKLSEKNTVTTFPLEERPEPVESGTYDRLLKKTHERISFVIGWLKKYMEEE